ncbi:MAG: hypothetical protein AEth_00958 [Candidatus Argoarchaeum ethanivorans]|uniref:Uncharacterized protein n=1 Tax=Candidatus Argoarchaeum ethanivorans TaxID=2608793 RepID=A0A8B3S2P3_9EURY|nr:MAG: hypothetical protein AEth_00958 [Candidatus Argoarchaeum ethanivorans]
MQKEDKASKINMKDRDVVLLKFNYKNLHESIWDNHKLSRVVTSIFIPVLFGVQGYLVRDFYVFSKLQVIMGVFITELLLSTWLLLMWTFRYYSIPRIKRLKEIEDLFNKEITKEISDFFKDRKGFNQYELGYGKPKQNNNKEICKKISDKITLSFMEIYLVIFWMVTSLNVILLGAKILFA